MILYGRKILFLGAHPDDIELGCGAVLSHISGITDVLCITLSDNLKNPDHKHLREEHHKSMEVLGIPPEKAILGPFETRNFPRDRQEILEYLYEINRQYSPDLVFVHTRADIHQDHAVMTDEALRAFRGLSVLGYDVLRSSYGFFPHFLIEVSEQDVELKIKALAQYETFSDTYYLRPEIIRSTIIRHGALMEHRFAEGFDILRIVASFKRNID